MSSSTTVSLYVFPGADQFARQVAGIKELEALPPKLLVPTVKFFEFLSAKYLSSASCVSHKWQLLVPDERAEDAQLNQAMKRLAEIAQTAIYGSIDNLVSQIQIA